MPKLDIPKPYVDTLALVRGRKRYKARELADLIDVSPPVMHARLEWLARKGLVTRENVGRGNEYFRPSDSAGRASEVVVSKGRKYNEKLL